MLTDEEMRDLAAHCRKMRKPKLAEFVEGAGREIADLKRRLAVAEREREDIFVQKMEANRLGCVAVNERDEARAEAAALREAAETSDEALLEALSQPGPGAALLERVRKLEAVASAQRRVAMPPSTRGHQSDCGCGDCETFAALAALEATP